jgi:predicted amidohydrolase YtcJ
MGKKYEIPLLKDHHTHTSIYASLSNCIDLSAVRDKKKALSLMKKSTDEITVILGWNSSFFYFEDEELDCLPPVVICNISFHDFLINNPARERGILIYSNEKLFHTLAQLSTLNKPIAIHAVGDLATDQIIKILSDIQKIEGCIPQIRIEHSQFISKESAETAKSLGIVLSMQPNFNNDSIQYEDRLSAKYCTYNNPFRMLIDEVGYVPGEDLIFGSDGMPHGAQYALEQSLFPRYADQALMLEEFIAGYCMPDQKNGYIKIEIDEKEKNIKTEIVSN